MTNVLRVAENLVNTVCMLGLWMPFFFNKMLCSLVVFHLVVTPL